jgi:hypothetical protein
MWQAKVYDRLGMSLSFLSAYNDLNFKSVQLEALGYIQVRHSLQYGAFDSLFKPIYIKFKRYEALNDRDLRMNLKVRTMDDDNYD